MSHLKSLVTSHTGKGGSEWLVMTRVPELFPWHQMSPYCWLSDESILLLKTSAPEGICATASAAWRFLTQFFKRLAPSCLLYLSANLSLQRNFSWTLSTPCKHLIGPCVLASSLTQLTLPYYPKQLKLSLPGNAFFLLSLFRTIIRILDAQWVYRKYFLNQ